MTRVELRRFRYRIDRIRICIRYNRIACLIACELKQKKTKQYNYSYIGFSVPQGYPGHQAQKSSKISNETQWDEK